MIAERERLLELLRLWESNARIGDFLDLKYMTEVIRNATDPVAPDNSVTDVIDDVDLYTAFQIATMLVALEGSPVGNPPLSKAGK